MATINFATREITAKVVYYGADGAGTTSAVKHLHTRLPSTPSRLHRFGLTPQEQMLFFEYVPGALPRFGGFDLRVQVYALPGAIRQRLHRQEVLTGIDGVVFVADARRHRLQANVDALVQLEDGLEALQSELRHMPAVIVVNHIDHPEARPESEVGIDLNTYGFPLLSAVARDGRGVLEAQTAILDRLSLQLRANLAGEASGVRLEAVHDAEAERDDEVVQRHTSALAMRSSELEAGRPSWDDLASVEVHIAMHATELEELAPSKLIKHRFEGSRLHLDLMYTGPEGAPNRVELVLDPMAPRLTPPSPTDGVGQYLPDSDAGDLVDLPPWGYGIIGVLGGSIVGLLLGYVSGLFG